MAAVHCMVSLRKGHNQDDRDEVGVPLDLAAEATESDALEESEEGLAAAWLAKEGARPTREDARRAVRAAEEGRVPRRLMAG